MDPQSESSAAAAAAGTSRCPTDLPKNAQDPPVDDVSVGESEPNADASGCDSDASGYDSDSGESGSGSGSSSNLSDLQLAVGDVNIIIEPGRVPPSSILHPTTPPTPGSDMAVCSCALLIVTILGIVVIALLLLCLILKDSAREHPLRSPAATPVQVRGRQLPRVPHRFNSHAYDTPDVGALQPPSPTPDSWSVDIATASPDEFEYDNFTDDEDEDESVAAAAAVAGTDPSGARRRKPPPPPSSPFDFGGFAAPLKSVKVSSAATNRPQKKKKKEKGAAVEPAGGLSVIRLVPASVDIFQTLLDLGPAVPRSRSSSTGNGTVNGAAVPSGLGMPTPTEELAAGSGGDGGGPSGGEDGAVGRPMASLAVPELTTDDDQTSDELEDDAEDAAEDLETEQAGLLNLARLGCRVQFDSTVVDNERGVGADGSGAGPSGGARIQKMSPARSARLIDFLGTGSGAKTEER
uniref:Uncharacterized protein n=1 Tax=Anopheles farauti TaxID=69004 RepID=A0A182QZZ1_9DIPT